MVLINLKVDFVSSEEWFRFMYLFFWLRFNDITSHFIHTLNVVCVDVQCAIYYIFFNQKEKSKDFQ